MLHPEGGNSDRCNGVPALNCTESAPESLLAEVIGRTDEEVPSLTCTRSGVGQEEGAGTMWAWMRVKLMLPLGVKSDSTVVVVTGTIA